MEYKYDAELYNKLVDLLFDENKNNEEGFNNLGTLLKFTLNSHMVVLIEISNSAERLKELLDGFIEMLNKASHEVLVEKLHELKDGGYLENKKFEELMKVFDDGSQEIN